MRKKTLIALKNAVCVMLIALSAGTGYAAYTELDIQEPYTDRVAQKLGRGIVNVAYSPAEIANGVETYIDKDEVQAAVTTGVLKGTFRMVKRILVGTFEIATFYVPSQPILYPPYVMSDKGIAQ